MKQGRFEEIVAKYPRLRIAVVGDFCLDRYLEIDPARREVSIETGLEVYNVVKVRSQLGAAGTILNNLVALGVGELHPVGFYGEDGEGYELFRAMRGLPAVSTHEFWQTLERRTFTYCKPMVVESGQPPRELNRLDSKNWSPTPELVQKTLCQSLRRVAGLVDAIVLMDQVDFPETGVVTSGLLDSVRAESTNRPSLLMIGDSRRSLKDWPPVCLKMNESELQKLTGRFSSSVDDIAATAANLARAHGRSVFVTLAERGIIGAQPDGVFAHVPAAGVRGEIDIVGAGDAVTANLTAALAAGATLREALEMAMAAASIVIHQLGTTGTARVDDIRALLFPGP